ncbi:LysE family translocator [Nocardioides sp.]|uniref:LysE family translocator n=1 Tax=Nocardioides sp. TaxID=35761 RepID=UPI00273292F3|nr:LysE family translocator [Nocardioides sp.]MDP3892835.1 LysE family translocator [Nocardioides sp.]
MPTTSQLLAFVVASLLFIQVPGPSLLFTIGRALTVGRRDALLSVVGNAVGLAVQATLVAVGLASVIAASATAYTAVKLVGAAYVIWLGIQAIRRRAESRLAMADPSTARRSGGLRSLRIGFVVGVTNPKTIVFFAAFLPQFANPAAGPAGPQLVLLGAIFAVLAVTSDTVWALAAGTARTWFARRPQRLDALSAAGGTMMIGLGASLVVAGHPRP